jgi:hypothetical protein
VPDINEPYEPFAQDEKDDDVEGHVLAPKTEEPAEEDEKDDVEGHVLGAKPDINSPDIN